MDDDEIRQKQAKIWPEVIGAVITQKGNVNLCPVNYQAISTVKEKPLTVCIGLANNSCTLQNILTTGEFTYAYPSKEQIKDILYCGTVSGRNTDKLANTKLEFRPAKLIKAPLLINAVANYECKVVHTYKAGNYTIVVGEIKKASVSRKSHLDKIYSLGNVDGKDGYGVIKDVTVLQRGR